MEECWEAEQALLGCMLVAPEPFFVARQLGINAQDFDHEVHQLIWKSIEQAQACGPIDLITVIDALKEMGVFESCGSMEYLQALIGQVPTSDHAKRYAIIVKEKSLRRQLRKKLSDKAENIGDIDSSLDELVDFIGKIRNESQVESSIPLSSLAIDVHDLLCKKLMETEEITPPLLGLPTWDAKLGGLGDEDLVVVKANTAFGKTTFLRQSVLFTAQYLRKHKRDEHLVVYLLEGTKEHWLARAISYLSNVKSENLRRGKGKYLKDEDWLKFSNSFEELSHLPIFITDRIKTLEGIMADLTNLKRKHNINSIYIDYIQQLSAPGPDFTMQLNNIARSLGEIKTNLDIVPIIASQVTVQDLKTGFETAKYSKALEEAASLVIHLRRGSERDDHNPDMARQYNYIRIINTKPRYAETLPKLDIVADFGLSTMKEVDMEHEA